MSRKFQRLPGHGRVAKTSAAINWSSLTPAVELFTGDTPFLCITSTAAPHPRFLAAGRFVRGGGAHKTVGRKDGKKEIEITRGRRCRGDVTGLSCGLRLQWKLKIISYVNGWTQPSVSPSRAPATLQPLFTPLTSFHPLPSWASEITGRGNNEQWTPVVVRTKL